MALHILAEAFEPLVFRFSTKLFCYFNVVKIQFQTANAVQRHTDLHTMLSAVAFLEMSTLKLNISH